MGKIQAVDCNRSIDKCRSHGDIFFLSVGRLAFCYFLRMHVSVIRYYIYHERHRILGNASVFSKRSDTKSYIDVAGKPICICRSNYCFCNNTHSDKRPQCNRRQLHYGIYVGINHYCDTFCGLPAVDGNLRSRGTGLLSQ
ncbi:MAG: hypothetical protein BWX78_01600 [Firmicutes bacterium ADurb.Bin099]|nr:MAG: hypothetical protein BWX78_01600 [Firmicutes bacterium ADurb.Bin099]